MAHMPSSPFQGHRTPHTECHHHTFLLSIFSYFIVTLSPIFTINEFNACKTFHKERVVS